jgi:hypothetical protein
MDGSASKKLLDATPCFVLLVGVARVLDAVVVSLFIALFD